MHRVFVLQVCKDKRTTLLESVDKVKLSYSHITAQTTQLTQQVLHITSQVRSQVKEEFNMNVTSHSRDVESMRSVHFLILCNWSAGVITIELLHEC